MSPKSDLDTRGWTIVPNVLTAEEVEHAKNHFCAWQQTIPNHDEVHSKCDPHGIYKFHEAGHQYHAWFIRTRPRVQAVFKELWGCDHLITSFDGACFISKENDKKDNVWTHTDQAPATKGLACYQGFVSLTTNKERTLVVYDKSHLLHEDYFRSRGEGDSKNAWNKIDLGVLHQIKDSRRALHVPAGALVLWDSRTFHQNQYGKPRSEERIVQYVCFLPRSHTKNTEAMQKKRRKYLKERRTTSHWPAPIYVNGKQPRTFGNKSLLIDYEKLRAPDLSTLMDVMEQLL